MSIFQSEMYRLMLVGQHCWDLGLPLCNQRYVWKQRRTRKFLVDELTFGANGTRGEEPGQRGSTQQQVFLDSSGVLLGS